MKIEANTMKCSECSGPVEVYDTNGATYPEPLVEFVECMNCQHQFKNILTP